MTQPILEVDIVADFKVPKFKNLNLGINFY